MEAGNSFSSCAPASSAAKASLAVAQPRRDQQAALHRVTDDSGVGIRGDGKAAAGIDQRIDMRKRQHGAGADPRVHAELARRDRHALLPVGRVGRDLDGIEPFLDERADVFRDLVGGDAAQDRDQRQAEGRGEGVHADQSW